jgi:hypothetical protein
VSPRRWVSRGLRPDAVPRVSVSADKVNRRGRTSAREPGSTVQPVRGRPGARGDIPVRGDTR